MKSKFIVIEGLEGAGKSSALKKVVATLQEHGIINPIVTRDPGGTVLAENLRVLITKGIDGEVINDYAELLMFYAARVQLIEEVIKPALLNGVWVISDRYDLSSHAYQGGGRGINLILLQLLRHIILKNFQPDLTLYLDVSPMVGLSRIKIRNTVDRIEMESLEFFDRVRHYYRSISSKNNQIITIDANQSLQNVHEEIFICLKKWLMIQDI